MHVLNLIVFFSHMFINFIRHYSFYRVLFQYWGYILLIRIYTLRSAEQGATFRFSTSELLVRR